MNRKRVFAIVAALVLAAIGLYLYAGHETPAGQPPLTALTAQNFAAIGDAFNADKDSVRVLLLLSPT